jgi:N-methylhydantoinase B
VRSVVEADQRDDAKPAVALPLGIDAILFEVLRSALTSVVDEMAVMLEKVAFSTVVSEGRDFSGAILTPQGDLVAQGDQDLPLIGGTIPFRVKALIATIPADEMKPGDIFVHNDPFLGGTHAQDVSLIMPVFWEGSLVAFVQVSAHWPDLGGPVPGSFNSEADSSYAEALLIPPVHIVREGEIDRDMERLILRNVRISDVISGDMRAMMEACRTGETRVHGLLRKYGRDTIDAEIDALLAYSERLIRAEISAIPDGTYSWTDYIDRDPLAESNEPLLVGLDLTIAGDTAIYDYSRTGPQAKGPVNAPISSCYAASLAVTKAIFPHIPLNQGILRAIELRVPPGTLVSAQFPAPVNGQACNAAEKIVSCVHGCYSQVVPHKTMACPSNLVNICIGGFDVRSERQRDYVMYCWLSGGWGARLSKKDNFTMMTPLASGTKLQPVEFLEREYPIIVEGYGLRPNSEGAGMHRGGFGLNFPIRLTDGDAILSVQGDREHLRPWGYDGGLSPIGTGMFYVSPEGVRENVGIMRAGFRVAAGGLLDYWQGGGGGWGHPFERPVEWVLEDVRNGLVSIERARDVYGVSIVVRDEEAADYVIDPAETAALRAGNGTKPGEDR